MTKIEQAQAIVSKRYQEYLAACQRVYDLTKQEENKVQERIAKINAQAKAKVLSVESSFNSIKTAEVEKAIKTYVTAERVNMNLPAHQTLDLMLLSHESLGHEPEIMRQQHYTIILYSLRLMTEKF